MTRKDRYTRNKAKHAKSYRITPEDITIMKLLARYRYLRSTMIYELLPNRLPRAIRYNLHKLFHHGYINKPKEQHRGYNSLECADVFELEMKGSKRLRESVNEATNLVRKRSDVPVKNFAHAMMICDTLASIEIGVNASDCTFITQDEIIARSKGENPAKLPCQIHHHFDNGRTERLDTFIIPDGLFGIRYPSGKVSFFALEAEHYNPLEPTTLKRASYLKKILAYREIVKSGVYKKQLNIPNLRVLAVFPTKTRTQHAKELVEQITKRSNLFLMNDIPVQEELWTAPQPFPGLFKQKWKRGGHEDIRIDLTN